MFGQGSMACCFLYCKETFEASSSWPHPSNCFFLGVITATFLMSLELLTVEKNCSVRARKEREDNR
uniref:Oligoribonuclease isoform X4 n=1 Tax=Rhizophora mucronata TaxID=61149 RepID=A0A2P2L5X1_RHIMU